MKNLIGAAVSTLVLLSLLLGSVALARGAQQPCVFVYKGGEGTCGTRPHLISTGAKGVIRKIQWRSWGDGPAVGVGRLFVAGFIDEPGTGIGPTKGKIRLRRLRECQGNLWYTRWKITYGKGFGKTYVPDGFYGTPCTLARPLFRATFQTCNPPSGTFYYSLRVRGTTCAVGRKAVTHLSCKNPPTCDRLSFGPWSCNVQGGIAQRATRCHRGTKRIVAKAAGD